MEKTIYILPSGLTHPGVAFVDTGGASVFTSQYHSISTKQTTYGVLGVGVVNEHVSLNYNDQRQVVNVAPPESFVDNFTVPLYPVAVSPSNLDLYEGVEKSLTPDVERNIEYQIATTPPSDFEFPTIIELEQINTNNLLGEPVQSFNSEEILPLPDIDDWNDLDIKIDSSPVADDNTDFADELIFGTSSSPGYCSTNSSDVEYHQMQTFGSGPVELPIPVLAAENSINDLVSSENELPFVMDGVTGDFSNGASTSDVFSSENETVEEAASKPKRRRYQRVAHRDSLSQGVDNLSVSNELPGYLKKVRNPERKKCQNRDAAFRYRHKKKEEQKGVELTVEELIKKKEDLEKKVLWKRKELEWTEKFVAGLISKNSTALHPQLKMI